MTIETGVTLMAIASAFAAAIFSCRLKAARSNGYAYSYMRGGSRRKHVAGTWDFKFDLIIFRIWIAIYSFCSLVMYLGMFFGNVR